MSRKKKTNPKKFPFLYEGRKHEAISGFKATVSSRRKIYILYIFYFFSFFFIIAFSLYLNILLWMNPASVNYENNRK